MRTEGRETLAKRRRVEDLEEQQDEETRAEVSQTEARARVVLRLATRSLMWVVLLGLLFYYLIKATLWVFYALTGILLVIVLAIFFAYLIAPLVELVRRPFNARGRERVMPRWMAIGVVYAVLFGSLGIGAWVLTPRLGAQMADMAKQAPDYVTNARARADRLNNFLEELHLPRSWRESA